MLIITDALPRGAGYLEIDQRAVPDALPPGVPRHFEADTYTCSHCNAVVVLNPLRKRERYKCQGCNHHVCDPCAAKMQTRGCEHLARRIEQYKEELLRNPALPPFTL